MGSRSGRWVAVALGGFVGGCGGFVSANEDGGSSGAADTGGDGDARDDSGGRTGRTASDSTSAATSTTTPDSTTDPDASATDALGSTSTDTGDEPTSGPADGTTTGGTIQRGCGDGEQDRGEACDDANDDELDGCASSCVIGPAGLSFGATFETDLEGGESSTGIQNATENCPGDHVLVGLGGFLTAPEAWIGVVGGLCQPARLSNQDPPAFRTDDPTTALPTHGQFDGGGPWLSQCADDQAIVALRGHAGDVMDGLQIRCADLETVGDPGAYELETSPTAWEPLQGGNGGSTWGPVQCPAGTIATGVQTETNSFAVRIRLLCREVSLSY